MFTKQEHLTGKEFSQLLLGKLIERCFVATGSTLE